MAEDNIQSRKNCSEDTVKSNWVFKSQINRVCIFPKDGSLVELFTQCIHL